MGVDPYTGCIVGVDPYIVCNVGVDPSIWCNVGFMDPMMGSRGLGIARYRFTTWPAIGQVYWSLFMKLVQHCLGLFSNQVLSTV